MKKIAILLLCLLLSSCSYLAVSDEYSLDDVFAKDQEAMKFRKNEYFNYFEFYLPSDLTLFDSDSLSCTMYYNNSRIVANVNISAILNESYFGDSMIKNEGYFDDGKLIYQKDSVYINSDDVSIEYSVFVYDYDHEYLVYLVSKDFTIYARSQRSDLIPLCSRLMMFLKGSNVNEDFIVNDFSNRDVIELEKKQVNLFETVRPVNGVVNEMMVDGYSGGPDE